MGSFLPQLGGIDKGIKDVNVASVRVGPFILSPGMIHSLEIKFQLEHVDVSSRNVMNLE